MTEDPRVITRPVRVISRYKENVRTRQAGDEDSVEMARTGRAMTEDLNVITRPVRVIWMI